MVNSVLNVLTALVKVLDLQMPLITIDDFHWLQLTLTHLSVSPRVPSLKPSGHGLWALKSPKSNMVLRLIKQGSIRTLKIAGCL